MRDKITKGKLIGRGRVAEVYAWGDNQVLKLFYNGRSSTWVEHEAHISRIAYETGFNTPAAGDVIEVEGRQGILFERVDGIAMLAEMSAKPWTLIRSARIMAEQQALMHEKVVAKLPTQQQHLEQSILSANALSSEQKEAAINKMQQLPTGNKLCHGDFHPDNIILSTKGAVTIDWTTASQGNPLADVARTSLILQLGDLPPGTPTMTRLLVTAGRGLFHKMYLKRYFELRPNNQEQFAAWQHPIAAARLGDGIVEEQAQLLALLSTY
jgi:uncharacterized protein (TIGR02172 family)